MIRWVMKANIFTTLLNVTLGYEFQILLNWEIPIQ